MIQYYLIKICTSYFVRTILEEGNPEFKTLGGNIVWNINFFSISFDEKLLYIIHKTYNIMLAVIDYVPISLHKLISCLH